MWTPQSLFMVYQFMNLKVLFKTKIYCRLIKTRKMFTGTYLITTFPMKKKVAKKLLNGF